MKPIRAGPERTDDGKNDLDGDDDAVLETKEPWARLLRGQRNIGDFICWKEHNAYNRSFDRLLQDQRVQ